MYISTNVKINKMSKASSFFLLIIVSACSKEQSPPFTPSPPAVPSTDLRKYPEALQKVFTQHGSLEVWQQMQTLSYEIVDSAGNEKQFVDLKDRRERIESPDFITGFDGNNFWIEADTSYKGNPVFYHNLMFYFYAMPFVLADDGINYSETDSLNFEGKNYPGIKISYGSGIGISPQDEYFIHYDPMTYEMAWLGYTVTYYSKEKSEKIKWIRYNDWKTFDGLLLPKSLTWYNSEEGILTEPRKKAEFEKVKITTSDFEDGFFAKTPGAIIVE